jgi:flagellar hook protein FlgE
MLRSLYTGANGAKVHQTYLDVTGNNTANVNTVGYKRDAINFRDMLYQSIRSASAPNGTLGGIDPAGVGLGVSVGSITPVFTQGSLQQTGVPTDVSISGEGFFVVLDGTQTLYTRAGNFALDKDGNLVTQGGGCLVQGYSFKDQDGTAQPIRDSALSSVKIPVGEEIPAKRTSVVAFHCNLDDSNIPLASYIDASASSGSGYTAIRPFAYTADAADAGSFFAASGKTVATDDAATETDESFEAFTRDIMKSNDWSASSDVYDSAGNRYTLKTVFRKVVEKPDETEWDWYSYYEDENGARLDPATSGEGAGTLVFGSDGLLKRTYYFDPDQLAASGNGASAALNEVVIDENGVPRDASGAETVTAKVGTRFPAPENPDDPSALPVAGESTAALDFLGRASVGANAQGELLDGVTQYSSASTTKGYYQDGGASGVLESWSVSQTGVINGTYSNGRTKPIAQLALAMFTNDGGLTQTGSTSFIPSANSGAARVGVPLENGAGSIEGNTIEMSNVELAEEFTNLIRSQRGFQANTRSITTSDQILEMLINLKR